MFIAQTMPFSYALKLLSFLKDWSSNPVNVRDYVLHVVYALHIRSLTSFFNFIIYIIFADWTCLHSSSSAIVVASQSVGCHCFCPTGLDCSQRYSSFKS